jgi:hypothetical protein
MGDLMPPLRRACRTRLNQPCMRTTTRPGLSLAPGRIYARTPLARPLHIRKENNHVCDRRRGSKSARGVPHRLGYGCPAGEGGIICIGAFAAASVCARRGGQWSSARPRAHAVRGRDYGSGLKVRPRKSRAGHRASDTFRRFRRAGGTARRVDPFTWASWGGDGRETCLQVVYGSLRPSGMRWMVRNAEIQANQAKACARRT